MTYSRQKFLSWCQKKKVEGHFISVVQMWRFYDVNNLKSVLYLIAIHAMEKMCQITKGTLLSGYLLRKCQLNRKSVVLSILWNSVQNVFTPVISGLQNLGIFKKKKNGTKPTYTLSVQSLRQHSWRMHVKMSYSETHEPYCQHCCRVFIKTN